MYQKISDGDSYDSPALDGRWPLRHYLLMGSRWAVYSFLFDAIFKYRGLAKRGGYTDEIWAHSSLELLHWLESAGARFQIRGLDQLRSFDGPAVFVANHQSTLETLMLPGLIAPFKPCTFVVKDSLTKGPVWGPVMRSRDPIALGRTDPRADLQKVLEQGASHLAAGKSIVIFPEGTRRDSFCRSDFNSLGAKLAARCGVPLVPIALKTDFWTSGRILRGFGKVYRERTIHFEFGPPLQINGRGKAEHEAVLDFIESRLVLWEGNDR